MKRRWFLDTGLIAALAFILRLIYVLQLSKTPFFAHPVIDAQYHDAWAREIVAQGICQEGAYFRAPLYPYFLALIYAFTGGSFLWARIFQALLGSLTAALTYCLGREISGTRRVGLAAGIGAACYGMLVYFDGELLVETLFISLLIASLLAYAKYKNSQWLGWLAFAGFFLGLAAITRASALVILPVFVLDILLANPPRFSFSLWRPRVTAVLLLSVCVALPIAPVASHNFHRGGDEIVIAGSGGINFYIGNNPQADGLHSRMPGFGATWDVPAISYPAYQAAGRTLKLSEVNRYYSNLAWHYIKQNPAAAAKLFIKKIFAFWNRLEISNNRDLYFFKNETWIMPYLRLFGFWILGPLGLVGLWIGWWQRLLPRWFLATIPVYMISVAAFFVTARFRAPMIPLLLICTSAALFHAPEKRGRDLNSQWLKGGLILLLAFLLVNTNPWKLRTENPAHSYFCLGMAYWDGDKTEQAEDAFRASLAADSLYPRAHLNLGVIAYRRGDTAMAEAEYQRELDHHPKEYRALNNLGILRYEAGRLAEAASLYEGALSIAPYYSDAEINLGQCRFQQGVSAAGEHDYKSALGYFHEACDATPKNALYHYHYALTLGISGQTKEAQQELETALWLKPDFEEARVLLRNLQELLTGRGQAPP